MRHTYILTLISITCDGGVMIQLIIINLQDNEKNMQHMNMWIRRMILKASPCITGCVPLQCSGTTPGIIIEYYIHLYLFHWYCNNNNK